MGTHPIFESDFDCLTVSRMTRISVKEFAEYLNTTDFNGRIRMNAQFEVKIDKVEKFRSEMAKLGEIALKKKGCTQYEVCADYKSPTTFYLVEDWVTKADLKTHWNQLVTEGASSD